MSESACVILVQFNRWCHDNRANSTQLPHTHTYAHTPFMWCKRKWGFENYSCNFMGVCVCVWVTVGSVGALPKVMGFLCGAAVYSQVTNASPSRLAPPRSLLLPSSLSICHSSTFRIGVCIVFLSLPLSLFSLSLHAKSVNRLSQTAHLLNYETAVIKSAEY